MATKGILGRFRVGDAGAEGRQGVRNTYVKYVVGQCASCGGCHGSDACASESGRAWRPA